MIPQDRNHLLSLDAQQYRKFIQSFFAFQLKQDGTQDLTTECLLGEQEAFSKAKIITKTNGILAGMAEVLFFCGQFFPNLQVSPAISDGERIQKYQEVLLIEGTGAEILKAERIILNVLARASGVATVTEQMVSQLPANVFLAATRKTLWGMLDKKAVAVGGGLSHRLNLADAILVKENHLSHVSAGAKEAAERIVQLTVQKKSVLENKFWEIEVESPHEFLEVLEVFSAHLPVISGSIMFDNFSPEKIKKILQDIDWNHTKIPRVFLEASGGITPQNYLKYAYTGVDVLSSGFLTHTAIPLDFSLRMIAL